MVQQMGGPSSPLFHHSSVRSTGQNQRYQRQQRQRHEAHIHIHTCMRAARHHDEEEDEEKDPNHHHHHGQLRTKTTSRPPTIPLPPLQSSRVDLANTTTATSNNYNNTNTCNTLANIKGMAPTCASLCNKTSSSLHLQLSSSSLSPYFHSPAFLEPASPTNSPRSRPQSPIQPLSPRALYADSFDRPHSPSCGPATRYRKNVKEMTGWATTEEEFDALPMAVRRKYFSTLERLRFAQNSRCSALNELPIQSHHRPSIADRRGLNLPDIKSQSQNKRRRSYSACGVRKGRPSVSSNDASWFLNLPEKIKQKEFTREERIVLAGRLRESVILDAADEAIYKSSRRASRNLAPLSDAYNTRTSSDSRRRDSTSSMAAVMYESFRWMDEEEDINLKLVLDDYHANLDGVVIPAPGSSIRPSFRRQLSVSKMPFGRNSLSSIPPQSPKVESSYHYRSKSRALSLISPRHMPQDSVSSIDPHATHYQDPEARLKLRVYLASPQKFDEAIEFGFPSLEGVTDGDKENLPTRPMLRDAVAVKKSFSTEKSFLADDTASLFDDDTSMLDPDSPLTPMHTEFRSLHPRPTLTYPVSKYNKKSTDSPPNLSLRSPMKLNDSYTQAMAGSREMTLRMTLTRPDLRADESQLYGWQASKNPSRDGPMAVDPEEKYEVKGPFGGADGWGRPEKESTGIKKLWQKVKHPNVQRRIS